MGIHRLTNIMPNGLRWSQPDSGVVFVASTGDIESVERGTIGSVGRYVDTGRTWTGEPGEDDDVEVHDPQRHHTGLWCAICNWVRPDEQVGS